MQFLRSIANLLAIAVATAFLALAAGCGADRDDWSGTWQIDWSEGGGHLLLEQQDDAVTGTLVPYGYPFEARLVDGVLRGQWIDGPEIVPVELERTLDGSGFIGRGPGWIAGKRTAALDSLPEPSFATPRDAFHHFLFACAQARFGIHEYLGQAAEAAELDPETSSASRAVQFDQIQKYFELVDLTTFDIEDVEIALDGDRASIEVRQSRSDVPLEVRLHRDAPGHWRVVVPSEDELASSRKSLLALYGSNPPSTRTYAELKSARDCIRSFLEGMSHWNGRGRELALSTLDLSAIPESFREVEGALAAGYLIRTLERIGISGLQGFSNDPLSRDPVMLLRHPSGSIVVAPNSTDANAPFKFDRATIEAIARIERETAHLDPAVGMLGRRAPSSTYFDLRAWVGREAPALRAKALGFELWQFAAMLVWVGAAIVIARLTPSAASRLIPRAGTGDPKPFHILVRLAVVYIATLALLLPMPQVLGIPRAYIQFCTPPMQSIAVLAVAVVAWTLVGSACELLMRLASRTETSGDDLAVGLLEGVLRGSIVVGVFLGVAASWSIEGTHLLAGLGIGGVAIAVASQNTIAHFFGAGTIIADRPFAAGDWIQTPIASGVVDRVGFRSTRVSSPDGTTIIVPNAALAAASIVNLGKRRPRQLSVQFLIMQGATLEKVEGFLAQLRAKVAGDPRFLQGRTAIGVSGIATNGFQVQCTATIVVSSDAEEADARHAFVVLAMNAAEDNDVGLGPQIGSWSASGTASRESKS